MKELERRIFVDETIIANEHGYTFGKNKNFNVALTYYNFRQDKVYKTVRMPYRQALSLARDRARDKRYGNYKFLINNEKNILQGQVDGLR